MGEVVVFPDVEMLVCNRLRAMLAGRLEAYASVPYVGNKTPNPIPERAIVVRCDGGPRLDTVRQAARVGINVWGRQQVEASNLARLVSALLVASPDGAILAVPSITAPYAVSEETQDRVHLYLTAEVMVRGVAA